MTASAKSLFRATKAKRAPDQSLLMPIKDSRKPDAPRRADVMHEAICGLNDAVAEARGGER